MDEQCMLASNASTIEDVLGAGQTTKALCFDVGRTECTDMVRVTEIGVETNFLIF